MVNEEEFSAALAKKDLAVRYSGVSGTVVWFTIKSQTRMRFDGSSEGGFIDHDNAYSAVRVGAVSFHERMELTVEFNWEWFKTASPADLDVAVVRVLELANKISASE